MTTPGRRAGTDVPEVHQRLRSMILSGELAPGERLSQYALAERLEVGRTPIREALRLLQSEGLVESEPLRSVRVAGLSLEDLEDLYVHRIALEATAVRLTAATITEVVLAELEGLLAQMDHLVMAGVFDRAQEVHGAFHAMLVAGAGPRMREAMHELFERAQRYMVANATLAPDSWTKRQSEHRRIVAALHAGSPEAAAAELTRHYLSTVGTVLLAFGDGRDGSRLWRTVQIVAPDALDAWPTAIPAPQLVSGRPSA